MQDTITINFADFGKAPIAEHMTSITVAGKEIAIKAGLGLTDTVGFVDSVAVTVVDSETGKYHPELMGFAFDAMILMYFTNVMLPADSEDQFELICYSDLCFEVKRAIDSELLDKLYAATDRKITHLVRCAENSLAAKMNDLLSSFAQLQELTQDTFENIGGAELKALVDHLSGMNEATLAKAVLDHQEKRPSESDEE